MEHLKCIVDNPFYNYQLSALRLFMFLILQLVAEVFVFVLYIILCWGKTILLYNPMGCSRHWKKAVDETSAVNGVMRVK